MHRAFRPGYADGDSIGSAALAEISSAGAIFPARLLGEPRRVMFMQCSRTGLAGHLFPHWKRCGAGPAGGLAQFACDPAPRNRAAPVLNPDQDPAPLRRPGQRAGFRQLVPGQHERDMRRLSAATAAASPVAGSRPARAGNDYPPDVAAGSFLSTSMRHLRRSGTGTRITRLAVSPESAERIRVPGYE